MANVIKFELQTTRYTSPEATGEGFFYKSAANRLALRGHLESLSLTRFKKASIGGEEETGFEQAFSSLAYSYIKDKSPRLLDFMIGFQLVERNEDNTKAMGLFGYRVGDRWLYTPVFFLNGDMKGHELLYLKSSNTFIPLKENWVNYVISQKSHRLGEPAEETSQQMGAAVPSLRRIIMPPGYGKQGSDTVLPDTQTWALPFLPFLGAMASCDIKTGDGFDRIFRKSSYVSEKLDLRNFFIECPGFFKVAYEVYQNYPLIRNGFDKFYGKDFFLKTAKTAKARAQSLISGLGKKADARRKLTTPPRRQDGSILPKTAATNPVADGKVRVFVYDNLTITHNLDDLDNEDREKLMKDTVLIKDERDPHEQSTVYNTQTRVELVNPTESGLYNVLEREGKFTDMVVLANPISTSGAKSAVFLMRKDDAKSNMLTHRSNVWVQPNSNLKREEYCDWFDGLSDSREVEEDATYIIVGPHGDSVAPFHVTEDCGNGRLRGHIEDYCYHYNTPSYVPPTGRASSKYDGTRNRPGYDVIVFNDRKGTRPFVLGNEVNVPSNFKLIKVKKAVDYGAGMSLLSSMRRREDEDKSEPISPGNLADAQMLMYEKTSSMKLWDHGDSEVTVAVGDVSRRMQKRSALITLVCRHGVTEPVAREMLKEASQKKAVTYRIKYALGFGPGAPAFPEPWYGTEQLGRNSVQAIYPQEEELPVTELDAGQTDPTIYDPYYTPDAQSMQVAQQASQSGQKEVFDTAMISGMLKTVRQESIIDRYLGPLMQALDKLGRLLFMFYWHQEEFEERYGKQDLPELEDSLRNSFETLGDVTLFLKEKSVGSLDAYGGAGVGNESEPSIAESARN